MRHLSLVVLALVAISGTAAAQARPSARQPSPSPTGLVLNVHAFAMPGYSIEGRDIAGSVKTSMGPGIGAQIGYAITPQYMVYASVDLARLGAGPEQTGHWGLGMIEVGGRMSFPSANRRLMPYVAASVGGRGMAAEVEDAGDVSFGGMVVSAGGGLAYALSPALALDGGVMVSLGKFGSYEDPIFEGDLEVDNTMTTRLRFGLNWRP